MSTHYLYALSWLDDTCHAGPRSRVEGDEKEVATALRTFHMVRSNTPYIWYAHKVARCQYNSPTPDTARFLSVLQVVRHADGVMLMVLRDQELGDRAWFAYVLFTLRLYCLYFTSSLLTLITFMRHAALFQETKTLGAPRLVC